MGKGRREEDRKEVEWIKIYNSIKTIKSENGCINKTKTMTIENRHVNVED